MNQSFISAGNSRKPLNCTRDVFLYLCTYHLIPPEFVEILSTLGEPNGDIPAFHQPQWFREYWRPTGDVPGMPSHCSIPELSRSGWEIRNCYRLSAMEKSLPAGTWSMRQVGAFHSFDLSNGRSFAVTVKANNEDIRRQITSLSRGMIPQTLSTAFLRFLEVQLLDFHSCVGGWKEYIGVFESLIRQTQRMATAIPFSSAEEKDPDLLVSFTQSLKQESATSDTRPPRQLSFPERISSFIRNDTKSTNGTQISSIRKTDFETQLKREKRETENNRRIKQTVERINVLQEFPFAGLQKLTSARMKLKEAQLVMSLNKEVLGGIRTIYYNLINSEELSSVLRNNCSKQFHSFFDTIEYLERLLTTECTRVDTLLKIADDGHNLVGCKRTLDHYQNSTD